MTTLQELKALYAQMQQGTNKLGEIIQRLEETAKPVRPGKLAQPYEMKYPLSADSSIFKGNKPTSVIIRGESITIRTWKQLVEEILKRVMLSAEYKLALEGLANRISGHKRTLLASTPENMRSPLKLSQKLYLETHYDTETLLNILTARILLPIGYDYSSISVTIRNPQQPHK